MSVKTLVVNNFNGRLTRYRDGDINSGMANFYSAWGYDCFQRSGTLTFNAGATDITKSVITDLIVAGKVRVESNITYVYAIGHTGRLYKIQVNDPTTYNPDYDNPVLITTLTGSLTFKYGASLDFYKGGGTEKIWIGHDTGVTKIAFDGSGQSDLTAASWVSNVPRLSAQFNGKLYFTNGSNLAEIDSTELVISYTKLSPGFPANSQARDIDVTADGRYLVMVVTRNAAGDMTVVTPDISDIACMPSMLVYWNGTDTAASSAITFPSFSMKAYQTFGAYEYLFGYQIGGSMLGTPSKVIIVDEFTNPPLPNAVACSGDFLGWGTTVFNTTTGHTDFLLSLYGTIDAETPVGHYRQLIKASSLSGGDVIRCPFLTTVSSFENAGSTSGYTTAPFQLFGTGKSYFSTIEYNNPTTSYGFYMYRNVNDYLSATNTGIYETQHQIFSKKVKPIQVRVYIEPANASTSFTVDLVGIDGAIISGTSQTFSSITGQTNLVYSCHTSATPAIGLRITNVGAVSPLIHKVEIDYTDFGD